MAAVALRIGDVARRTGLSVRTLRLYDELGLLVPSARTSGDHRLYSPADLDRLLAIQHLKALGLSLSEVRAALDDPGFDAARALAEHIEVVAARLAESRDLLARLRSLQSPAESGWEEVTTVIALTERLQHPEATVRVRAALDGGTTAPLGALLDQLADEPDEHVSATLTWAIARKGHDAVAPVVHRLADPDPRRRERLVHTLGKLADPDAVPALVAALDDDDVRVVTAAVTALGRIADPSGLAPLVDQLGGGEAHAVTDAIARFGAIGVEAVTRVMADGGPEARRHAAEILGAIGDQRAVRALAARLADEDPAVRLAALSALGHLPGDAADSAISRAAGSRDRRVRAVAVRLAADRGIPPR